MPVDHESANETETYAEDVDPWTGYAGIDRRALETTRAVVATIDQDPALVRVGLKNIERWTRQAKGYPRPSPAGDPQRRGTPSEPRGRK